MQQKVMWKPVFRLTFPYCTVKKTRFWSDDVAFKKMGAVHIVLHNAGGAVGGPITEMKHSDWEWTLRVNLWGPIHGVELFTPRMIAQGEGGHMVFTASFGSGPK